MKKRTILDLFEESVNKYPNYTFLMEKIGDKYETSTYSQVHLLAKQFGAGLCSLGIKPKSMISIFSEGCNNWIIGELGLFYAGCINVPISIKIEEPQDLIFRLNHAEVSIIITSSRQINKIRSIRNDLKYIEKIIIIDSIDELQEGEYIFSNIIKLGNDYLKDNEPELNQIAQSIDNQTIATITYTSGTTSDPKGVILTHRNYTANVEQSLSLMSISPQKRMLIILPLDHCFAHVVGFYIMIATGSIVATVQPGKSTLETLKNIPINIMEVKPNILLSVPALAKNFKKNIETSIKKKGALAEKMFNFALKVSYYYNKEGWNRGSGLSILLYPLVKISDKLLFSKVKLAMGGQLEFFVGGGALLDIELQRFYYALGIPMFQGYGLSEATPVISTNTPSKHKLGSSGIVVKPLDIKILDSNGEPVKQGEKGEIVIRGENVMAGYWKNTKATEETIKDGWLHTGDMGYIDQDDFLYVLGRFKSLLISSDGEKFSPEGIEEMMVSKSTIIQQIMLYNNQCPYTTAVITPSNYDKPREDLIKEIEKELLRYRKGGDLYGIFPERWIPSTFIISSEPFSESNKMINSTMKLVRSKVEEVYKEKLDYLYTSEGKSVFNKFNIKN